MIMMLQKEPILLQRSTRLGWMERRRTIC